MLKGCVTPARTVETVQDQLVKSGKVFKTNVEENVRQRVAGVEETGIEEAISGSEANTQDEKSQTTRQRLRLDEHRSENAFKQRQITEPQLKIGDQTVSTETKVISRILSLSKNIAETYGFVTLQFFNRGYLNITKSWVCNVKCMGVLPKILFIATDQVALDGLSKFHPEVQVLPLPLETLFKLSIGFVAYYRFILLRTWVILVLLQSDIPVTLIESDAVWFDDALPIINSYAAYDIVSAPNGATERGISGGFIYLSNTQVTKALWWDVFHRFEVCVNGLNDESQKMGYSSSEMKILSEELTKTDIRVKTLPLENFVSGLWYKKPKLREITNPVVIQVNYVIGVDEKIKLAKRWGHWFLTDDGQCEENNAIMKCQ
ncbi:uncharacterized protein [Ptychodera flava]|uniref:uncharacterized protein n=1 Tax=Ptychodera flava TaxID=63121 RepID=UPI00396A354C